MTKMTIIAAVAALACTPGLARTQDYPNAPIHLISGFPAGSTADISARVVGAKMGQILGQQVVIENRLGAASSIAGAQAARAPKDGYTLFVSSAANMINAAMNPNLNFDIMKDFAPIVLMTSTPTVLTVIPELGVKNVKELTALAKEKPDTIGYATPGVGSIQQLSMELLSYLSGAKFLHVPYRGGAPALNDTIGGHVPISVLSVFQVLPLIQEGKLKALAVTDTKRTLVLPNVQTVAEAGVANYEASLLFGLIAPPGLPPAMLAKINAEVVRIINAPEMQKKLAAQGVVPIASTPDAFVGVIKSEQEKWAQVIKAANIKE